VQVVDDLVVHRAAELRVRMQHDGDGRVAVLLRVVAAFEPAFGAGKITSGIGASPLRPRDFLTLSLG
jgi:hypothetical protein